MHAPPPSGIRPSTAEEDWIAGDTITGHWTHTTAAPGRPRDPGPPGGRGSARAFTHLRNQRDSTAPPSLNYSRGAVIDIAMKGDKIDRVMVTGQADGVQLEPVPPRRAQGQHRDRQRQGGEDRKAAHHKPKGTPVTARPLTPRLAELLAVGSTSLTLGVAALARIADSLGRTSFAELAIAYREDYLRLQQETMGARAPDPAQLSGDDVRTHLGNSVLPRLAQLDIVTLPVGGLWSEAPVAFSLDVWFDIPDDRDELIRLFRDAAGRALVRDEAATAAARASAEASVLEAHHLVKAYKSRRVVNDVSIQLEQGEIVGPARPEWGGEDHHVLHDDRPDPGRSGTDLPGRPGHHARADVPARPARPRIPGAGAVGVPQADRRGERPGHSRDAPAERRRAGRPAWRACSRSSTIKHLRRQKAYQLSGGERRRLEITRALVTQPKFMLLDEPFAGVDPIAVHDIQTIVAGLRHRGIGVLITDHSVEQTLDIVDRAYIMFEGKVQVAGTVQRAGVRQPGRQPVFRPHPHGAAACAPDARRMKTGLHQHAAMRQELRINPRLYQAMDLPVHAAPRPRSST